MTIHFYDLDECARPVKQPYQGADHLVVDALKCCGSTRIRGKHRGHDHDTYRTPAACLDCGADAGRIEVRINTIFGIEEDERVLFGRVRVY